MKKSFLVFCMLGALLMGCSDLNETKGVPLHPLLSEVDDEYSLLIVSGEELFEEGYHNWMKENEISNVDSINGRSSLEKTNERFKFLEIERSPAFVVFDTKDIVFKTYDEKELIEFLHNNNP